MNPSQKIVLIFGTVFLLLTLIFLPFPGATSPDIPFKHFAYVPFWQIMQFDHNSIYWKMWSFNFWRIWCFNWLSVVLLTIACWLFLWQNNYRTTRAIGTLAWALFIFNSLTVILERRLPLFVVLASLGSIIFATIFLIVAIIFTTLRKLVVARSRRNSLP